MDDDIRLRALEQNWVKALVARDVEMLASLWTDEFVFTDPHGNSLSRDRCLEGIASGEIAFTSAEVRSMHVRVLDDTGIVLGIIALDGQAGSHRYAGDYSFFDVYRRAGRDWRAVLSSGDYASGLVTGSGG